MTWWLNCLPLGAFRFNAEDDQSSEWVIGGLIGAEEVTPEPCRLASAIKFAYPTLGFLNCGPLVGTAVDPLAMAKK